MNVPEFIEQAHYDEMGAMIFANKLEGMQLILDVRAYGALRYIASDINDAAKLQDELGRWITEAINEKIEREKSKP